LRLLVFLTGAAVVAATFGSALRTVMLPRGIPSRLTRLVFLSVRQLFRLRAGPGATFEKRDRVMAVYAPFSLLVLLSVWLILVMAGYTAMFLGAASRSIREAFLLSGSSLLTLGFTRPTDLLSSLLAFSEAGLGLALFALLITFLPTIYAAFSRREAAVNALEVRAGSPPSGVEMILRFSRLGRVQRLTEEVWVRWEDWFGDVEESHTSFPALVFFRSPQPDHSWITAAGAVLDAASMTASVVATERDVQAELTVRAGYIALRRICDVFRIPYDPEPLPGDPIGVDRGEFDEACARLAAGGVPLRPDLDRAWKDFRGWRVNYDQVLIALAGLTMAPYAPWSSDRSLRRYKPLLTGSRRVGT
jgi:hypothetical protein